MAGTVVPRASYGATLRRLVSWALLGIRFLLGTLGDIILRRDSPRRRAQRLRRTIETSGGTFLKLGQQLSLRIDLLPGEYCEELGRLLDRVAPFSTQEAVAIVERSIGGPLDEVFEAFDPEPIGSASIACVYQGVLEDGSKVAVKVRRPGIVETFAADRRALSWIVGLLELSTLVRPGILDRFLEDLGRMFAEELDFRREARNTDLFRKGAQRSGLRFITAPEIRFDLSSSEVLVSELVSGVWLWEVLGAVETQNPEGLAHLSRHDIDPVLVGRRLYEASLFGIFDNMIYHADPHPANVVVRPGSRITLIDFGSCGTYSQRQLAILRQFQVCQASGDVGGMVQCALQLLEPLPPVDIDAMTREAEEVFGESVRAVESSGSEWWERTSANVWLNFLRVARRYHLRVDLDILRLIRSTLLYDTVAARLVPQLDIYAEYRRFRDRLARSARKRFQKRMGSFVREGFDDLLFLRLEEMSDLAQRTAFRLRRAIDAPNYRFSLLAGKTVYAISTLLGAGLVGTMGLLVASLVLALVRAFSGAGVDLSGAGQQVLDHPIYQTGIGLVLLVAIRRILMRFGDRDV